MPPHFLPRLAALALLQALLAQGLAPAERTRIEQHGAQYVSAVNSEDRDARAQTISAIFASEVLSRVGVTKLAGQMEALRQDLGRLELHHAEVTEMKIGERISRVLHVYARAAKGQTWRDLQFRVEPASPHRLTELAFVAEVAEPVYLPNGSFEDPSTLAWLNGYIDRLADDAGLSGAVLIAKGATPIIERYFGSADAHQRQPIVRDTLFGMASGSKMFTAIAAAQLVEQGKLSYGDSLAKFFPAWPGQKFARKVTLHHLLSHTSGIRDYWTTDFDKVRHTITGTADLLPWIEKAGVAFEPGARAEYSNSNFALIGLIVEKVSRTSFPELVHAAVLKPAGMLHSGFHSREQAGSRLAQSLIRSGTGWAAVEGSPKGRGTAAGGAITTAREMLQFSRALHSGALLQPATLRLMTTPQPGRAASALQYGFGFELSTAAGIRSYGHGGQATGANFAYRFFPQLDLTVVLLSNQDNGAFDDLNKSVVKLVTGER
jgi:CubicO group peptidase (beta-lactamase class C family)